MSQHTVEVDVTIDKSPEDVIGFVSDIRNRQKYQQSLTSVSDIEGQPGEVGASWHWRWDFGGYEFEGIGRCVEFTAGKRYAFVTEGGIASRFTYDAAPDDGGTKLSIRVEVEMPEALAGQVDPEQALAVARQKGQESVQRLKAILEAPSEH